VTCDEHRAERNRAYREANRDKVAERQRAYYEANRDKVAEWNRAYREAKKRAQVMDGHGTQSSYDAGCRCDICNAEQAERELS
jgi:hypothetical protein